MMFPILISVSLAPGSQRFCASAGLVAAASAIARTATVLANPIASSPRTSDLAASGRRLERIVLLSSLRNHGWARSEEHTSELQSRVDLVCRLLLEKKKKKK